MDGSNSDLWLLLRSGAGDSAFNMAVDEALLEAMPRLDRAVLRFYGWAESAASFGYFQKYADVERLTALRPLVRRLTGGGVVPHEHDWTYSLVFPTTHEWYSLSAVESYHRVHEWIQAAFARLELVCQLAPHAVKASPGKCFAGCERFDLLWNGQKIAGAAQRRRKDGLLIQGSVQPLGFPFSREVWEKAMTEIAQLPRNVQWVELDLNEALQNRAINLARGKYGQEAYRRRR